MENETEKQMPVGSDALVLPLLVACHTDVQLHIFARNHLLNRIQVVRIRREDDARGRGLDRPIHLLPDWWQGTEPGTIPRLEQYGWKMVKVTEEQVLNGTFSWQNDRAMTPGATEKLTP